MAFHLEVVTAERSVFSDTVDEVVAPGVDGEFGVLSNHEPFLTALNFGELRIKRAGGELDLALGGGFLECRNNRVIVLADSAERAEEIDLARAEIDARCDAAVAEAASQASVPPQQYPTTPILPTPDSAPSAARMSAIAMSQLTFWRMSRPLAMSASA